MYFSSAPNPMLPDPSTEWAAPLNSGAVVWTVHIDLDPSEVPTWSADPPEIVTVSPSSDGRSAMLTPVGYHGTATITVVSGKESVSQPLWIGRLLCKETASTATGVARMVSQASHLVAARHTPESALMWSPTGNVYVLNSRQLIPPDLRSAHFWSLNPNAAAPAVIDDPVYLADYGRATFYAPESGMLFSQYGPSWSAPGAASADENALFQQMDALDALVAWAPTQPPASAPPVSERAAATGFVLCYILNLDLLDQYISQQVETTGKQPLVIPLNPTPVSR